MGRRGVIRGDVTAPVNHVEEGVDLGGGRGALINTISRRKIAAFQVAKSFFFRNFVVADDGELIVLLIRFPREGFARLYVTPRSSLTGPFKVCRM